MRVGSWRVWRAGGEVRGLRTRARWVDGMHGGGGDIMITFYKVRVFELEENP